jgi:hypothetical protein
VNNTIQTRTVNNRTMQLTIYTSRKTIRSDLWRLTKKSNAYFVLELLKNDLVNTIIMLTSLLGEISMIMGKEILYIIKLNSNHEQQIRKIAIQ